MKNEVGNEVEVFLRAGGAPDYRTLQFNIVQGFLSLVLTTTMIRNKLKNKFEKNS